MARREYDPVLRRRAIDLLESGKAVREVAENGLLINDQATPQPRPDCRSDIDT